MIVAAACRTRDVCVSGFGRHLSAHFPSQNVLLQWDPAGQEGLAFACTIIGDSYLYERRYPESEQFLEVACANYRRMLGGEHVKTLRLKVLLACAYEKQGKGPEAEALLLKTIDVLARTQGEEHFSTLWAKGQLTQRAVRCADGLYGTTMRASTLG